MFVERPLFVQSDYVTQTVKLVLGYVLITDIFVDGVMEFIGTEERMSAEKD